MKRLSGRPLRSNNIQIICTDETKKTNSSTAPKNSADPKSVPLQLLSQKTPTKQEKKRRKLSIDEEQHISRKNRRMSPARGSEFSSQGVELTKHLVKATSPRRNYQLSEPGGEYSRIEALLKRDYYQAETINLMNPSERLSSIERDFYPPEWTNHTVQSGRLSSLERDFYRSEWTNRTDYSERLPPTDWYPYRPEWIDTISHSEKLAPTEWNVYRSEWTNPTNQLGIPTSTEWDVYRSERANRVGHSGRLPPTEMDFYRPDRTIGTDRSGRLSPTEWDYYSSERTPRTHRLERLQSTETDYYRFDKPTHIDYLGRLSSTERDYYPTERPTRIDYLGRLSPIKRDLYRSERRARSDYSGRLSPTERDFYRTESSTRTDHSERLYRPERDVCSAERSTHTDYLRRLSSTDRDVHRSERTESPLQNRYNRSDRTNRSNRESPVKRHYSSTAHVEKTLKSGRAPPSETTYYRPERSRSSSPSRNRSYQAQSSDRTQRSAKSPSSGEKYYRSKTSTYRDDSKRASSSKDNGPKHTSQEENKIEKANRSLDTLPKYTNSHLKVAIIDKSHPRGKISLENEILIKKLLKEELDNVIMLNTQKIAPAFRSWTYSDEIIKIFCEDENTLDWLTQMMKCWQPWSGAMLKVVHENQLPKLTDVTLFIPLETDTEFDEREVVLYRLAGQNPTVRVDRWTLLQYEQKTVPLGHFFIFAIRDIEMEMLRERSMRLNYLLQSLFLEVKSSAFTKPAESVLTESSSSKDLKRDPEMTQMEIKVENVRKSAEAVANNTSSIHPVQQLDVSSSDVGEDQDISEEKFVLW